MALRGFTIILIPDENGYQVEVPHFPGCTTWGETPQKAFENAKEALELLLEEPGEFDMDALELPSEFPVVIGKVDVEVPNQLSEAKIPVSADVIR